MRPLSKTSAIRHALGAVRQNVKGRHERLNTYARREKDDQGPSLPSPRISHNLEAVITSFNTKRPTTLAGRNNKGCRGNCW
jgi:hypothetical protein